jgi:hypothetical protein
MNEKSTPKEIARLTSSLLDETITRQDLVYLDSLLLCSKEHRKKYLEIIQLESLLHWEASDSSVLEPLPSKRTEIIFFPWISSIAAIFLAIAGSWWSFLHFNSEVDSRTLSSFAAGTTQDRFVGYYNTASSSNPNPYRALGNAQFTEVSPLMIANEFATKAMEFLTANSNNNGSPTGTLENYGSINSWSRLSDLSVTAKDGVLPSRGQSMQQFSPLFISMDTQDAQIVETVQVLDVREALKISKKTLLPPLISASVKFNQSHGECQESAEYGLSLSAYRGAKAEEGNRLLHVEKSTYGDLNPSTWHEIRSEIEIPAETDFVVVSLSTRKSGPDALLANTSSYFSDDLELSLSIGNHLEVGPI